MGGRYLSCNDEDLPAVKRHYTFRKDGGVIHLLGTVKGLLSDADLVLKTVETTKPKVIALTCNREEVKSLDTLSRERPRGYNLKVAEEVQALGKLMWSWECSCGVVNPHGTPECTRCGKRNPATEAPEVSGRASEWGSTAHAAADNIWVETGSKGPQIKEDEEKFGIGDIISQHDEMYMSMLGKFGKTRFPSPAFLAAIEAAKSRGIPIRGIDMPEEEFTDLHCREVGYMDLLRSTRVLAKIGKRGIQAKTPEDFALGWDRRMMGVGAYENVEQVRTQEMVKRLSAMVAKKAIVLCVSELERVRGIAGELGARGFRRV